MVFVDTIKRFTVYEQLCVIYHRIRAAIRRLSNIQRGAYTDVLYTIHTKSMEIASDKRE